MHTLFKIHKNQFHFSYFPRLEEIVKVWRVMRFILLLKIIKSIITGVKQ